MHTMQFRSFNLPDTWVGRADIPLHEVVAAVKAAAAVQHYKPAEITTADVNDSRPPAQSMDMGTIPRLIHVTVKTTDALKDKQASEAGLFL